MGKNYYGVEFVYFVSEGWECYKNYYCELEFKTLDEIFKIRGPHDYFFKFRIFDFNCNPTLISPFVVFEPRMRKEGELTLDECGYLFEDNLEPKIKLVQD